jgi:omega-amidase
MKAALIQLDIAWQDRRLNYEKAALFAMRAATDNCDLIVLPEMFNTGFSMDLPAVADEGIGETTSILSDIAKKNSINLIAGFPMKSPAEEKGRNIAVIYDRTGMLSATYTKMHPFCLAEEEKYYMAGESVTIFNIDGMPSSVFICYDLRFPEIFRKIANQVKAIFVISNWPASRVDHWETLLAARAIENQCFVFGVNRTGTDGNGIIYSGASRVVDPLGQVICQGNDTDEYVVCEFDPSVVDNVRAEYPFLKDMRCGNDKEK